MMTEMSKVIASRVYLQVELVNMVRGSKAEFLPPGELGDEGAQIMIYRGI